MRSGGAERRVAVCRQCHRTCLANSSLRQQQQITADSNSAIGKHWLATWLSCSVLHQSCCIPSVMVEIRYAGVDRAAGYWGKLVRGSCWTLQNIYSRIQSQLVCTICYTFVMCTPATVCMCLLRSFWRLAGVPCVFHLRVSLRSRHDFQVWMMMTTTTTAGALSF